MIYNKPAVKRIIKERNEVVNLNSYGNLIQTLNTVQDLIKYNRCKNLEELMILVSTSNEFKEAWNDLRVTHERKESPVCNIDMECARGASPLDVSR